MCNAGDNVILYLIRNELVNNCLAIGLAWFMRSSETIHDWSID